MAVRLDHLAYAQLMALGQEHVVLVRGVDQESFTGLLAPQHEDVVVDRADDVAVHLDLGVLVMGRGHGGTR
jgi:hypothetical protein